MVSGINNWVFAHRGLWVDPRERNSPQSLNGAFKLGMGVETDFRDFQKKLVISHDTFVQDELVLFEGFNSSKRYAANLKSDGLLDLFMPFLEELKESKSFVFDGSIPEMVRYKNSGIPHALRLSEYESELPWYSEYLWVDAFNSDWWIDNERILNLFEKHHLVFVSPELHGRDHRAAFDAFVGWRRKFGNIFSVCTDLPNELLELSNG